MSIYPHKLPQDIYDESLQIISNVYFSRREIDIIACLLNGRSAKSVGDLLLIAPRTVETHTRNINLKLERNSRESIRNFIEKSGKLSLIRDYYDSLSVQCAFEKCLRAVTAKTKERLTCLIVFRQQQGRKNKPSLISQMEEHLKISGITPFSEAQKSLHGIFDFNHRTQQKAIDYRICVVDEAFLIECQDNGFQRSAMPFSSMPGASNSGSLLFLLLPREPTIEIPQAISGTGYIDCNSQTNYYALFFEVLRRILPLAELDPIIADFKREYENNAGSGINNPFPSSGLETHTSPSPEEDKGTKLDKNHLLLTFLKRPRWLLRGVGVLSLAGILVMFLIGTSPQSGSNHPEAQYLGSDLPIPSLLNRHKLMEEIGKKLTGSGEIHAIALIGMGGAGKTTLARQYAHTQKASVIWEINAETKISLANSFEALAYALCQADEEKKILMSLKDISNFAEKEEKIIQLVRDHLKAHPNWFLIYDNVERFSDIQKYFPSDTNFWGKGKIIITTQDTHIQNNTHVKDTVWVGELTPDEKLSLFMKIMNLQKSQESFNTSQQELAKQFLEKIPSFPLDISVAAYYLKATNIDYDAYLKYLSNYSQNFSTLQETILKESRDYAKTRYQIITLTLEKLMSADKDFGDLLLLISLLDSKNIPRDLLDRYKGKLAVDNFIYYLKKYSLIVNPSSQSTAPLSHVFIHRSTQDIAFSYLSDFFKLTKDSALLRSIVSVLDDYLDQTVEAEDFPKMQVMVGHLERFLQHPHLLTDFSKGLLESKLGCLYYFLDEGKSHQMIRDSLKILKDSESSKGLSSEDKLRLARSLLQTGSVYTEIGHYQEAQILFERSLHIYHQASPQNELEFSWVLSHLGNVYRRQAHFEKARELLEKSIEIQEKYGDKNYRRSARTLSYLGNVYRWLGDYTKSIQALEKSLKYYEQSLKYYEHYLPKEHFRIGWVYSNLGNLHRKLGHFEEAKTLLEKGLKIYQANFSENHVNVGLMLAYLGNAYRELKDYKKARFFLEKGLVIYEKQCQKNWERISWIAFRLAKVYVNLGNYEKAHELFNKALMIYKADCKKGDIERAEILSNMGEIYLFEDRLEDAEQTLKQSLKILQDRKHPNAYASLELLTQLYEKRYIQAIKKGDQKHARTLKNQAIGYLNEALEVIRTYFPGHSLHLQRMQSKLTELQKME